MREDKINNLAQTDVNLRDAILQEEQQLPQMPVDLNARLMQRISAQQPRRQRRVWPWIAAACVAAILVVYLTPPKFWQGSADDTAQTDVRRQLDVRGQCPGSDLPGSRPLTSRPAELATAAKPKAKKKLRRNPVVVPDKLMAAQTAPDSAQPVLVAAAAPQPAAKMNRARHPHHPS